MQGPDLCTDVVQAMPQISELRRKTIMSLGRIYTAQVSGIAVTAIQDFFEVNCPSDAVVVIHSIRIAQYSDVGDAAAEMLPVQISRSTGSAGSGGTVPTARPHQVGTVAFGGTVEVNNTVQAGTTVVVLSDAFNIRSGWFYNPPPDERVVISPSGIVVVELPVAPADELTMEGSITFEEIGG